MKIKYTLLFILIGFTVIGQESKPFKNDGDCLQMKGIVKNNTKIYAEPDASSSDRSLAEKFTILYMFEHDDTGRATKNNFYKVGKSHDRPTGYISADDVTKWNHRLCLSFTDLAGSARTPGLVYKSLSDAKEEDWDSNKKPNSKAIGQEPTKDAEKKYDMLLPVLKEESIDGKGKSSENMKAYKIAFLGESGDAGGVSKPVFTERSKLDLMFLIDATASMGDEINGAKQVVRSLINTMKSLENTEVRMGISLYKDFGDDFVTRKWQELTTDYSRVISSLADIEVSGGGDAREAMYDGVLTTINSTNWSKADQTPVLKEILIIGDAPGHSYGGDYKVDASDLITKASEERVRFIAMNVGGNEELEGQMGDLSEGLRDGDQGLYFEASAVMGSITDDYLDKLSRGIKAEIERVKLLEGVRSGKIEIGDVPPVNRAIFLKNLPASGFEDIGVHFNEGWITEKNSNGKRQVQPFVYMTYPDLNKYKFLCHAAISVATSESADDGIVELTTSKIDALTGEKYDPETELDDHISKTLCLPSSDSGILAYSLSEISRWSPLRKEKFLETIDDKLKVLDQILRDNKQWRKPKGTDLKYTFVKLELMP